MSTGKGLLLVICLLFLPLKSALALNCYFGTSGGTVEKSEAIQPFAVPGNAKPGDKIWESDDIKIPVYCDNNTCLLYTSDIEMLRPEQLTTHPFLQRVGPDVLDPNLTPEVVKERLLSPRFRNRQFAGLLLDQAFLAGLGNYLRVEILWQVGLTGNHKAKDLNAAQLDALAHALLDIPRFSYATRGQVDENKHHGALFRFKVFHRDGELCERCGGIIEKTTLSSRPFYWCPGCQH